MEGNASSGKTEDRHSSRQADRQADKQAGRQRQISLTEDGQEDTERKEVKYI